MFLEYIMPSYHNTNHGYHVFATSQVSLIMFSLAVLISERPYAAQTDRKVSSGLSSVLSRSSNI
jgi:hypothetical protein